MTGSTSPRNERGRQVSLPVYTISGEVSSSVTLEGMRHAAYRHWGTPVQLTMQAVVKGAGQESSASPRVPAQSPTHVVQMRTVTSVSSQQLHWVVRTLLPAQSG